MGSFKYLRRLGAYEGRDKPNVLEVANVHKYLLVDKEVQQHILVTLKALKGLPLLQTTTQI